MVHVKGVINIKSQSNREYPPCSSHEIEIRTLVSAISTVIEGRSAYYVSTPMTSGKTITNSPDDIVGRSSFVQQEFMQYCNQADVQELVQGLRESLNKPVINPSAIMQIPNWTQSDYRIFSARIIEQFVHTVVFVEDWQYSLGCSYEFLTATRTRARIVSRNFIDISASEGIRLISEAVNELKKIGNDVSFLTTITHELENNLC